MTEIVLVIYTAVVFLLGCWAGWVVGWNRGMDESAELYKQRLNRIFGRGK